MPRDITIKSILIVGSGPIIIGQACEFDYSGSQAARSLREEGIKVILINSNPATIMTDPMMADKVYLLPLTIESIEQILKENQIDAVLPTMGGKLLDFRTINIKMISSKIKLENDATTTSSSEAKRSGEKIA